MKKIAFLIIILLSTANLSCYSDKEKPNNNTAGPEQIKQRNKNAYKKIDSVKHFVQTGDLITRTGADFTSESLRSLNRRSQEYSHCGIASIENDTVFVYHSLGGEWNPDQKIRRDALELFANPIENRGIGIFRFTLTPKENRLAAQTAAILQQMGIMFDMQFNLATNNHMYCAEFVSKSYTLATNGKLTFSTSHIAAFEFIGVDDIFLHPMCKLVGKILYK